MRQFVESGGFVMASEQMQIPGGYSYRLDMNIPVSLALGSFEIDVRTKGALTLLSADGLMFCPTGRVATFMHSFAGSEFYVRLHKEYGFGSAAGEVRILDLRDDLPLPPGMESPVQRTDLLLAVLTAPTFDLYRTFSGTAARAEIVSWFDSLQIQAAPNSISISPRIAPSAEWRIDRHRVVFQVGSAVIPDRQALLLVDPVVPGTVEAIRAKLPSTGRVLAAGSAWKLDAGSNYLLLNTTAMVTLTPRVPQKTDALAESILSSILAVSVSA